MINKKQVIPLTGALFSLFFSSKKGQTNNAPDSTNKFAFILLAIMMVSVIIAALTPLITSSIGLIEAESPTIISTLFSQNGVVIILYFIAVFIAIVNVINALKPKK